MSGRWTDTGGGGGGDSSQDFTQGTQEESALELEEYTQVEPVADASLEDAADAARAAEPVPWGRLMRLSGGSAISLMPRPEQPQGRALNEVTLGRGKVCEVQVSDQRISSKHCRIYCEVVSGHLGGMEIYVEDMSANGTWINQDTKLMRGHRRLLHSGDEIALLNPYKHLKRAVGGAAERDGAGGAESGKEADESEKLEAEAATFTFINLNRNRGMSHGRAGSLSVAETLRAGTVPGVSSPVLRSSASGVAGIFGGARKVEDLYDVREMIGHGTSGEVRRAINRMTGKEVAVKVIETRKFALTPGLTPKELVQEAEMLKRVDHKYIIKLEDIFQTEQAVYLVMDLVSGGDLFDRIVEKGIYEEDLAQELLFRVLTAVEYLHSQDIVHRDLKPENILLVGRDNHVDVKITDFGLAKRANKEGLKTFCGTPQYFAPEVLKRRNTVLGVGRYGKEADMWSVGVILYILLSGTHPFHTTTLFDQISHASYSLKGEEWAHISNAAKDLVSKLLTESPKARLTAAQALAHPFITERAAAKCPDAPAGGRASSVSSMEGAPRGETTATPSGAVDGGQSTENGGKNAEPKGAAAAERTSSQDTDLSSTSGAEDASSALKSLSPTEGGGGSAKGAPAGAATSPEDVLPPPPPRAFVPELPPPQPREPGKGDGVGGRGAGRVRKRLKKEGGGEKPPPPYSQLQMHVVRVGGSADHQGAGGSASSQETATGGGGGTPGGAGARDSDGVHAMSAPTPPVASNGRNRAAQAKTAAKPRAKPRASDLGGTSSQGSAHPKTPVDSPPAGRGNRKVGGGEHAPQSATATGGGRSSARYSAAAPATTRATDMPADDDIMDYSSDDSPSKGKRARARRGRHQEAAERDQPAAAAARGRTSAATSVIAALASPAASAAATVAGVNGGAALSSTAAAAAVAVAQPRDATRGQQMHLKVGNSGKLNLSKLGPLSRAGAGSASSVAERADGDRLAQAAAGGPAASLEDSVGGGAPAGGGSAAADGKAGKGGGKKPTGSNKPQRTMTHLWKRAGTGKA